jgi:hypothetical protein
VKGEVKAMRETLSLLRWYHWRHSFWSGHYKMLINLHGADKIYKDTFVDIKRFFIKN